MTRRIFSILSGAFICGSCRRPIEPEGISTNSLGPLFVLEKLEQTKFKVILKNRAGSPLRFWWHGNSWADRAYFFRWRSQAVGNVIVIKRKVLHYSANVRNFVTIESGGEQSFEVNLMDESWSLDGLPAGWHEHGLLCACYKAVFDMSTPVDSVYGQEFCSDWVTL